MLSPYELGHFELKLLNNLLFVLHDCDQVLHNVLILPELPRVTLAGEVLHLGFEVIYEFGLLGEL